jgi:hypothetical protein
MSKPHGTKSKFSEGSGHGRKKDHSGIRYGMLTAIAHAGMIKGKSYWTFRCDCGNESKQRIDAVLCGRTKSCGCTRKSNRLNVSKTSSKPTEQLVKIGDRFGRLVVIAFSHKKGKYSHWLCQCDCGRTSMPRASNLSRKDRPSKSCGCLQRETAVIQAKKMGDANLTHGMTQSIEYNSWRAVLARCLSGTHSANIHYKGRGITICNYWMSFENFFGDMGNRPSIRHTLDRIDPNGHYSCGHCEQCINNGWTMNCRWATDKEQQRNRRRHRMITFNGETKMLSVWAEELGMKSSDLLSRIKTGWPLDLALTVRLGEGRNLNLPPMKDREIDPYYYRQMKAVEKLNIAVKSKRIIKPANCQYPGCKIEKIEAHHHKGYEPENWLDVQWLCKKHHEEAEKLMPKAKGLANV